MRKQTDEIGVRADASGQDHGDALPEPAAGEPLSAHKADGDGQSTRDTQTVRAVSDTSPTRKRGRPRKTQPVATPKHRASSSAIPSASQADGGGQLRSDIQGGSATSDNSPSRKGRRPRKTSQSPTPMSKPSSSAPIAGDSDAVGTGEDQAIVKASPSPLPPDLSQTIEAIQEAQYRRTVYIRESIALENRLKALMRRSCGFSVTLPEAEREKIRKRADKILEAVRKTGKIDREDQAIAEQHSKDIELFGYMRTIAQGELEKIVQRMESLSRTLPVDAWRESVKGFGRLGMAVIVAEAGDIGTYKSACALWKRLGLAVIGGRAQGKPRGISSLSREEKAAVWSEHGYSPSRRAEMFAVIADPLLRQQWAGDKKDENKKVILDAEGNPAFPAHPKGPYGAVYGYEKEKATPRIEATADLHDKHPDKWTPGRVDKHARRLMTKALLVDLYRVWRGQEPRGVRTAWADAHVAPDDWKETA